MELLAHAISLAEPAEYFAIQFLARAKTEAVDMVARRESFDLYETWIFKTPSQHHMTHNSISPQAHCSKLIRT
jgi:hypothetical protein